MKEINDEQKKKARSLMSSKKIVRLHESGKPRSKLMKEYDLTPSAFDKWVCQHKSTGSFNEKDNRTPEQEELIRLRKENNRLAMENDILMQAALIMS